MEEMISQPKEGTTLDPWLIQPWGDVEGDVPTVPPELEAMAYEVIKEYDMSVSELLLITTKPDKGGAIWKIQTNHGPRSLKVLHRTPARSLFSVGAQQYLVEKGARVPALIPDRRGELSVERGGKLWIVTDWIEPLTPAAKVDLTGAQQLCFGLGEFHKHSQGYTPPKGAVNATRLHRYPMSYYKILNKLDWFRHIATLYSDLPASQKLLSLISKYAQQARNAMYTLEQSPYKELVQRGEATWGFAHQDYGWSNGQVGPDGQIWIIDLDGVAFDLPIRDLRKLMTSTMEDMGQWDLAWIRGMIDAYHQSNPIEPELMQVLLIDMAMPNEFYKHVKEVVYAPELFLTAETEAMLDRMEATDATKWPALQELGAQILEAPADWVPSLKAHLVPASNQSLALDTTGVVSPELAPEIAPGIAYEDAPSITPEQPLVAAEELKSFDNLITSIPAAANSVLPNYQEWVESLREQILAMRKTPTPASVPSFPTKARAAKKPSASRRSSASERTFSSDWNRKEPESKSIVERAQEILNNTSLNLELNTIPQVGQMSPYTQELLNKIMVKRKERRRT